MIREDVDGRARTVRLVFAEEELAVVANALNEVCHGVDIEDFEFSTRLGADREEARDLLAAIESALDELPPRE